MDTGTPFRWASPALATAVNQTCRDNLIFSFTLAQHWKMFDRALPWYDGWVSIPGQLADGRVGVDVSTMWQALPPVYQPLNHVPVFREQLRYPTYASYAFAMDSKDDAGFWFPYRQFATETKLNPLLVKRPVNLKLRDLGRACALCFVWC